MQRQRERGGNGRKRVGCLVRGRFVPAVRFASIERTERHFTGHVMPTPNRISSGIRLPFQTGRVAAQVQRETKGAE